MGIIAVSDVHLGFLSKDTKQSISNKDDFDKFLDNVLDMDDIDKFVICGDLLDMWRRDMSGVVIENADTLHKLQMLKSKMDVYYIVGNHDYHVYTLDNFRYQFEFFKEKPLQEGGRTYRFKHGYDFDPTMIEIFFNALCYSSDELGDIGSRAYEVWKKWRYEKVAYRAWKIWRKWADELLTLFQEKKIRSDLNRMLIPAEIRLLLEERNEINLKACKSVKDGEVLVFGHTHEPFINEKKNVVNLGSWVKDSEVHNTYLEIKNGKMSLKIFPEGKITQRWKC